MAKEDLVPEVQRLDCVRRTSGGVMPEANSSAADLGIMAGFPPPLDKRVSLENWDSPPFNRWSFQNIRSILPTRVIARGSGPAAALTPASQELGDLRFT